MQDSRPDVHLSGSSMSSVTPQTYPMALLGPDNVDPSLDGWTAADFTLWNNLSAEGSRDDDELVLPVDHPIWARLRPLAERYKSIGPGHDNTASNTYISTVVEYCVNPHNRFTFPFRYRDARFLFTRASHRIALAKRAERLVTILDLKPFPPFNMFDDHEWRRDADPHRLHLHRRALIVLDPLHDWLFPRGPMRGTEIFPKPKLYLAAAFANQGLDELEVSRRLLELQRAEVRRCFGNFFPVTPPSKPPSPLSQHMNGHFDDHR
ncbi:MAG: hypothetical protein M1823_003451 [Watsoniomyces obsoletus]|nr:MAG: hypothetical protein M1823_003451 [Watsoniomyces obsoletus]